VLPKKKTKTNLLIAQGEEQADLLSIWQQINNLLTQYQI